MAWNVRGRTLAVMLAALGVLSVAAIAGGPRIVVDVNDVIRQEHRLEIPAGSEVIWTNPHFERVWFSPGSEIRVERTQEGYRTVFERPGVYHGLYTVVGGHTSGDVFRMTVIVEKQGN